MIPRLLQDSEVHVARERAPGVVSTPFIAYGQLTSSANSEDSESLTYPQNLRLPLVPKFWVRLRFKDNEILEGLMPSDLTQNLPEGYLVNPPDQRSNTQRIFVPRTALDSLTVLAVIGATRRPRRGPTDDQRQVTLFEE